jgi:hypothetical protein
MKRCCDPKTPPITFPTSRPKCASAALSGSAAF